VTFRARKVDDNQRAVVKMLEAHGCRVQSLASVGNGCPDLLIGHRGKLHLLEVKNKAGRGLALTPLEAKWHQRWAGLVTVVATPDQALAAVGLRPVDYGCACGPGAIEGHDGCICKCHERKQE